MKDVALELSLNSATFGIDELVAAPWNARKMLDERALDELAESIRQHGVLVPLVVRRAPDGVRYEIICGHRRHEAARRAKLDLLPAVVRELNDDEAREIGLVDNLQREDLSPVEEAEAYGKLLDRPGATVESVAAAVAKSPSYVGRRLKLLDAIAPVRQALKESAIEIGHALELARLTEKQQQELLDWLDVGYSAPEDGEEDDEDEDEARAPVASDAGRCAYCGDGEEDLEAGRGWANDERTVCTDPDCAREARRDGRLKGMIATRTTVGELRSKIARTMLRVLRDVPFPLDDEIPPMACTACPKRAAGAASLFADIAEDTCTDPECLNSKLRVWVKAQLEQADRSGKKLAMLYDGGAQDKAGVSRWNCVVGAECSNSEPAIWVSGSRLGHMVQICRDSKCAAHGREAKAEAGSGARGGVSASAPKQSAEEKRKAEAQKAERAKLAEKVQKEREYRARLFAAIAQVPEGQIDAPRIALLVKLVCFDVMRGIDRDAEVLAPALGWGSGLLCYGAEAELRQKLQSLTLPGALRAAALSIVAGETTVTEWGLQQGKTPEQMELVASWLGIDVKVVRSGKPAPAAPEANKRATAAKPTKKAPKGKQSILSAEALKRIKEAQQKRWSAAKKAAKKSTKKGGGK